MYFEQFMEHEPKLHANFGNQFPVYGAGCGGYIALGLTTTTY